MAHRLEPHPGQPYLDPLDALDRLRTEFAYVAADAEQGQDDVGDIIAKLIELKAPQAIIDEQMAGRARSFSVTLADEMSSDDYLSFILQPGIGPLIGYYSEEHEAAAKPLLERCASALNYRIRLL
jgi:hypothetical protein